MDRPLADAVGPPASRSSKPHCKGPLCRNKPGVNAPEAEIAPDGCVEKRGNETRQSRTITAHELGPSQSTGPFCGGCLRLNGGRPSPELGQGSDLRHLGADDPRGPRRQRDLRWCRLRYLPPGAMAPVTTWPIATRRPGARRKAAPESSPRRRGVGTWRDSRLRRAMGSGGQRRPAFRAVLQELTCGWMVFINAGAARASPLIIRDLRQEVTCRRVLQYVSRAQRNRH